MQQKYEDEFKKNISGTLFPNFNHVHHASSADCVAKYDYIPIKKEANNVKNL